MFYAIYLKNEKHIVNDISIIYFQIVDLNSSSSSSILIFKYWIRKDILIMIFEKFTFCEAINNDIYENRFDMRKYSYFRMSK